MSNNKVKPFIKWVGGKTQLLDKIVPKLPNHIDIYCEPFLGGGALLLYVLENHPEISVFIANDLNKNLIDTYECIKYNHPYFLLIDRLKHIEEQFNSTEKKKEFYYERRKEYNYLVAHPQLNKKIDSSGACAPSTDYLVRKSTLFIFLNKTAFNGLYRVNKKGEFNVPFNNAKSFHPDFTNIENLHKLFLNRDVKFLTGSYDNVLELIEYEQRKLNKELITFVYMDPPYKPLSKEGAEVSYTSTGFGDSEQQKLKEFCDTLNEKNILFLQSNSDPIDCKFFDNLYGKYKIKRVYAKRNINSDGKKRGPVSEILIKNY